MGIKGEYRSRIAIDGLDRTPHRAFLRACGLDDDDLDKPQVGIVSTQGENTPCSMSLGPQADISLVYARQGLVPLKVRAFLDFAAPRLKMKMRF